MLTLFKDIFWQDQYSQSSTVGKESKAQKLDRDRYFIGLAILSAFFFVSLYGSQFLYPSYDAALMDDGYWSLNLVLNTFSPNLMLDPIALILTLMLSQRAFGRWLALPVGLVTFCILSLLSMGPYITDLELGHSSSRQALLVLTVISLIWLVFQLVMLARPALKHTQPDHPMVRLNPAFAANKQYTAVQYMWRFMLLSIALVVCSLMFSVALYLLGPYLDMRFVYGVILVIALAAIVFTLLILIKRLRNLDRKPLPWLLGLFLVPSVYAVLQAYVYNEDYFDLLTLFTLILLTVGFMRLMILAVQVWLLAGCYSGANKDSDITS